MKNKIKGKYSDYFCPVPFESVYIDYLGNMTPHCEGLVTVSMGNLSKADFMEVWNSEKAQKIRQSILDRSFHKCIERRCWALQNNRLLKVEKINNHYHKKILNNGLTILNSGPAALNLGYDTTCNLQCGSCRTDHLTSKNQRTLSELIHRKIIDADLKDTRRVVLSCFGEPFASTLYMEFLQKCRQMSSPQLRIQLLTNGLLLTPDMWNSISACHGAIDNICISIDAASEITYKKNRGGNFSKLLSNLEFLSELRKKNLIKNLVIDFVVQANNYREIPSFIEFGKKYSCDYVAFKHIENWGTYTDNSFKEVAIHDHGHPDHNEFLKILEDPAIKDSVVWLRNLAPFVPINDNSEALMVCDTEVFDIILNGIQWDFFRSKLSLTDIQESKIKKILNDLKDDITELYSSKVSGETLSSLEFVSDHLANANEMDENSLLTLCEEYISKLPDTVYISTNFDAFKRAELHSTKIIEQLLSRTQQNIFRQLIKIKPIININTGYFPMKDKLNSLL